MTIRCIGGGDEKKSAWVHIWDSGMAKTIYHTEAMSKGNPGFMHQGG